MIGTRSDMSAKGDRSSKYRHKPSFIRLAKSLFDRSLYSSSGLGYEQGLNVRQDTLTTDVEVEWLLLCSLSAVQIAQHKICASAAGEQSESGWRMLKESLEPVRGKDVHNDTDNGVDQNVDVKGVDLRLDLTTVYRLCGLDGDQSRVL